MADDLANRGGQDRARISLHERHEVAYWTKALHVTEAQLHDAVKAAGDQVVAVHAYLASARSRNTATR